MYDYFHRELLKRSFAMADETRVQVLNEEGRRAQTQSFMWLFRSGEDGLPAIILYGYSPTRSGSHARKFLEGYSRYLETDGYQGYNNFPAETYLEDGRCSFTNNLSENAIRPFAVGRKNWLFSNSVEGANASAVVYTMVEMAKAHGLNIYEYLKFLLEHRPGKDMTDEQLAELAPWSEKLQSIKNRM